ncbi:Synaptobrevin [Trinorchestia longiramus]|nr:Synaptobrevin [Trinorchestia longiramus]
MLTPVIRIPAATSLHWPCLATNQAFNRANKMSSEAAPDSGAPVAGEGPQGGLQPGGTGENGEIVGGPRTPQQMMAQKRMQQTQAQVDSVVDIMKANVEKVLERDQKLSALDERADALQQGAAQFEQQAGALKNKMWWKNMKVVDDFLMRKAFFQQIAKAEEQAELLALPGKKYPK